MIGDVFGGARMINAALGACQGDGWRIIYLRDGTAGVPVAASRVRAIKIG